LNDTVAAPFPAHYLDLQAAGDRLDFTMPGDLYIGSLLRTLVASKPAARVLELGTGTGLSLAWMLDGLNKDGTILSIDKDEALVQLVGQQFAAESRVSVVCADGATWMDAYKGPTFDLVFADAWPGKFWHLDEALALVSPGGFYIVDDLNPADSWPEGHAAKVDTLIERLASNPALVLTKFSWSTGVILAAKR